MVEDEGPRELHVRSPLARDRDFAGLHWASTKFDWPVTPELTPTRGGGGGLEVYSSPPPPWEWEEDLKGRIALHPYHASARSIYQPPVLPLCKRGRQNSRWIQTGPTVSKKGHDVVTLHSQSG